MDPELQALLQQLLTAPPEYDSKGNVKPYSLTEAAKRTNFQQDQMQNMANPLYSIFSGQGSFDPQDFADIQDGQDTYSIPDDPLQAYLDLPDKTSDESVVADMLKQGAAPSAIVAKFKANGVTDEKQLAKVEKQAQGLFDAHAKFRKVMSTLPGISVDENGDFQLNGDGQIVGDKLVVPKFKRSPAAMAFDKAGLPTPDKQYTPDDFYKGDAGAADLKTKLAELAKQTEASKTALDASRRPDPNAGNAGRFGELQKLNGLIGVLGGAGTAGHHQGPVGADGISDPKINGAGAQGAVQNSDRYKQLLASSGQDRAAAFTVGKGQTATQKAAEDAYGKNMRAQRIAENQLKEATGTDTQRKAYAQRMAELHAQNGLTPLTLMALKRAQGML